MRKSRKNRRMCTSTLKFIAAGAVIGVFVLVFTFAHAWGEYDKMIESRAATNVFADIDMNDFGGQTFTRDDAAGTKIIAYNVWETT